MYDTILVPLDGSKRAEIILTHITELAKKFNSKLILLTVVELNLLKGSGEMAAASMGNFSISEEKVNDAKMYLDHLRDELIQHNLHLQVETRVVVGLPVAVIKEAAEEVDADLIALASHGHGGLARVFYGSVAAAILNQVDRPLFLIRSRSIKE